MAAACESESKSQNPQSILNFLFQERKNEGRQRKEGRKEGKQAGAASRKDNIDTRSPAIAFSLNATGEHKSEGGGRGGRGHARVRTGLKFLRRRQDDGIPRPQGHDGTNQLSDSNGIFGKKKSV